MDLGNIIKDSLTYTKEGVFSNISRWLKLIIALIPLGIPLNGYAVRIYRNAQPAPEVNRWGTLFTDGLKLMVIGLLYVIPVIILLMAFLWTTNILILLLMYVFEIIVGVLLPIAYIRFARTGSIPEAFNFSEIFSTIRKIGWINYILALILVALIVCIPIFVIFGVLIVIGLLIKHVIGTIIAALIITLIVAPIFAVFQARFITQIYNLAEPAP
jgi:Protein of unknown function (DUF4013)